LDEPSMSVATPDRMQIERLVRDALTRVLSDTLPAARAARVPKVVAHISARHCHLTQADVERLFGNGQTLKPMKYLYQDGKFASEQGVAVIGRRQGIITNLRILGPCRGASQVELAFTDGIARGIDLPVRCSGAPRDTPGCWLMGPAGMIEL